MEKPIKMDDLGVPLFSETPICALVFSAFGREIVKRNETLQVSDTACGAITTFSGEFVYKQVWEAGLHSLKRTGHPLTIGRVPKRNMYFAMIDFQGRAVSFREGTFFFLSWLVVCFFWKKASLKKNWITNDDCNYSRSKIEMI